MNHLKQNIDYSKGIKYSGYGLFNSIFFALIAIPLYILFLNIFSKKDTPFLVDLCVTLVWSLLFYWIGVRRYNYFILSNQKLIVKNIFWPYKNININIDDIQEANIQIKGGGRFGVMILELRRKDLSIENYWSDSITDKNWRELRNHLLHFGIQVNVIGTYIGRLD